MGGSISHESPPGVEEDPWRDRLLFGHRGFEPWLVRTTSSCTSNFHEDSLLCLYHNMPFYHRLSPRYAKLIHYSIEHYREQPLARTTSNLGQNDLDGTLFYLPDPTIPIR